MSRSITAAHDRSVADDRDTPHMNGEGFSCYFFTVRARLAT